MRLPRSTQMHLASAMMSSHGSTRGSPPSGRYIRMPWYAAIVHGVVQRYGWCMRKIMKKHVTNRLGATERWMFFLRIGAQSGVAGFDVFVSVEELTSHSLHLSVDTLSPASLEAIDRQALEALKHNDGPRYCCRLV